MNQILNLEILKFPSTPHLMGSRLQPGDKAASRVPLGRVAGRHVVIEEKKDGGQAGLSFTEGGDLLLQSRGHYLVGGWRERQFAPLKPWATAHAGALLERLEDRFITFGEWSYAKHSIYMDRLPHYFLEFDVLDRRSGRFLSTRRRRELFAGSPVVSVPVLYEGPMPADMRLLWKLVFRSLSKSRAWRESFELAVARDRRLKLDLSWEQTDKSDESEGLYIKVEDEDHVLERLKLVRASFTQTILDSSSHHAERPILPNQLVPGVDLYAPESRVGWEATGWRTLASLEELVAFDPAKFEQERPW